MAAVRKAVMPIRATHRLCHEPSVDNDQNRMLEYKFSLAHREGKSFEFWVLCFANCVRA